MKAISIILISVFLCSLLACDSSMPASALVQYVNDPANGLKKNKTSGAINIGLQYKPVPYLIAHEFRKNEIKASDYKERQDALQNLQHFNLQLSVNQDGQDITRYGLRNPSDNQGRLYYLSFGMRDDIRLIEGQDTLAPVAYHFERSYDLANHRTFVLAFESKKENIGKDKTLILRSKALGIDPTAITISQNDLNKIPKIKLL